MAKFRHRFLSASSAGVVLLVLLVLLALSVVAFGEGGVQVCPSYPADPTWKSSISAEEMSVIKTQKKRYMLLQGTFEQGVNVLLNKRAEDSAANEERVMTMAVKKLFPSNSRGVYKVSVVLGLKLQRKQSALDVEAYFVGGSGAAGALQHVEIMGDGTFDEASGELCVLGCILSVCKYKLSLKYPAPRTILNVATEGNLTSVELLGEPTYFDPISIRAFDRAPFQYTMNATVASMCPTLAPDVTVGKFWNEDDSDDACSQWSQQVWQRFKIARNPDCEGANCSLFSNAGFAAGENTSFLQFHNPSCAGNRLQATLDFTDRQSLSFSRGFMDPTASNRTLLAEGIWNSKTGQMCMIACHLYGKQECDIAITAQLPLTFTVVQRSTMVGHIQSLRKESDPAYFKRISFSIISHDSSVLWVTAVSEFGEETSYAKSKNQPEYVYTKVETAKAQCANLTEKDKPMKLSTGKYPSGEKWNELDLYGTKDLSNHQTGAQYLQMNIYTRDNKFVARMFDQTRRNGANVTGIGVTASAGVNAVQNGIMNVSYSINYPIGQEKRKRHAYLQNVETMAGEGSYDSNTGKLCLIGCREVDLKREGLHQLEGNPPKDCQTFFTIQLPPIGSAKGIKGTVKSLRDPTDPLYFQPESFSGNEFRQAAGTLWRIDLEIVLSVLMLSLTVVCLLRQVLYSKRYPESLPYISVTTLLLLSLAHMIPLVLDFEALFQKQRYNTYRRTDSVRGWPEVNKVVVRFTTMAAMLLQLRLLQLVWKSRTEARLTGKLAPAVQERRVLYYMVPLYVAGGLIAVLFRAMLRSKPHQRGFQWRSGQGGVWWDLHAYGGLLLDLHLLPQVLANVLWDATEQAPLSKPFYVGMAVVRSVPHIYDLCRRLRFVPPSPNLYEFANPEWDFYSGTSDVLIPCGAVLLATVVAVQQRWGGRCFLPRRWRSRVEYEKVENPVAAASSL